MITRYSVLLVMLSACLGCTGQGDSRAPASAPDDAPTVDCEERTGPLEKIDCYVSRATEGDDPAVCGTAVDEGVRYQCYSILAERRVDPELCAVIPIASPEHQALRDACVSDVAKTTSNADLCEEIRTAGLRDSCYAAIGRDTGDRSLCDRIEDAGLKSLCTGEPVIVE